MNKPYLIKRFIPLLILTVLLLAACSSEQQTAVSETATPEIEEEPPAVEPTEVTPTEIEPTEATVSEPGGNVAAAGVQMECTLVSDQPDTPAEFVEIFSVKEDDWVKGPETAAVTFVEYGDFQ